MSSNALITLGLLAAAGCGTELPDAPKGGLALDEVATDHVSGTFTQAGQTLDFDFSLVDGGRHAEIRDRDGLPVLVSTLIDGVENTRVLDRVTIAGRTTDTAPRVSGDATALEDLAARPEAMMLVRLRAALAATVAPRALWTAAELSTTGTPRGTTLQCGDHVAVATWSYWEPASLVAINLSRDVAGMYRMSDGLSVEDRPLDDVNEETGPWAALSLDVTNLCWFGTAPIYVDGNPL